MGVACEVGLDDAGAEPALGGRDVMAQALSNTTGSKVNAVLLGCGQNIMVVVPENL